MKSPFHAHGVHSVACLEMYNRHLTICNDEVSDVLKWQLYACNLYNLCHAELTQLREICHLYAQIYLAVDQKSLEPINLFLLRGY